MSWEEGLSKIEKLKGLESTIDTFLKEVEVSSWEDAQKTLPSFADRNKLLAYSGSFKQGKGMESSSKEFKVQAANTCRYLCESIIISFIRLFVHKLNWQKKRWILQVLHWNLKPV